MKLQSHYLAQFLPPLIITLFFLYPMADADLGWHLRLGDTYLALKTLHLPNSFSSPMPNYIWPNHSWAFDLLLALCYRLGGLSFLSVLGAILIGLSFTLITRTLTAPQKLLAATIFIFFNYQTLNTGLRSQLISLAGFAYLFSVLLKPINSRLNTLPFLFVFWTNLHGQHLQAFGLFTLFCLLETYRSHQAYHPLVWLASFASLIINPFGLELFTVTTTHLLNPALKQIYEWMPWELNTPRFYALLAYLIITIMLLFKAQAGLKFPFSLRFITLILGVWSLTQRRMIPFFLLTSLPLTIPLIFNQSQFLKHFYHRGFWILSASALALSLFLISGRNLFPQTWDSYCHTQVLCSEPLIQFLQNNQIQGKILNSYRLGGHLIYRYPELKVYIDGRMTVWEDSSTGSKPFLNYLTLIHNYQGSRELFYQENFDYVIIHPQFELTSVLVNTLSWPKIFDDGIVQVYRHPRLSLPIK